MKITIIQLAINENQSKKSRMQQVDNILSKISEKKNTPDLIVLPELWGTGFFNFDSYLKESEILYGQTFSLLAPLAEELNSFLLTGSFIEKDENKYYNTNLLLNRKGKPVTFYRKIHLFGYNSREKEILTAGNSIPVIKTDCGTWGISTCYDLRFPYLYRLITDKGTEIILVIAAWPAQRIEHWTLLNRVRALENQAFLVACNCAGTHQGMNLGGHSIIVSPAGEILAAAGEREEILEQQIDLKEVRYIRQNFPILKDRKTLSSLTVDLKSSN